MLGHLILVICVIAVFSPLIGAQSSWNNNMMDNNQDTFNNDMMGTISGSDMMNNFGKYIIDDNTCSYESDSLNVYFDLSPLRLQRDASAYTKLNNEDGYSYAWNVCGSTSTASTPMDCLGRYGGIIQYTNEMCYIAGKFKKYSDSSIDLLDSSDPSKGLSVAYADGDICSGNTKRSSSIDIYCGDSYASVVSVEEPRTCFYRIVMESYYGCPKDCSVTKDGLCSGAGDCKYDSSSKKAYCACHDGYSGEDCSEGSGASVWSFPWSSTSSSTSSSSTNSSSSFINIIFTIIKVLLIVSIGAAVYLVYMKHWHHPTARGYQEIVQVEPEDVVMLPKEKSYLAQL